MVVTLRGVILGAANVLLLGYMLLVLLRVALTWFPTALYGRQWTLLQKVTDPYLAVFRRIRFLRGRSMDFSPLAALFVLWVARYLVSQLLSYAHLTVGLVLGAILGALWESLSILFLIFVALCVLRLVGLGMRTPHGQALWQALDIIVQPVTDGIARLVAPIRRWTYPRVLALTAAVLLTVWFLGGLGVRVLVRLLVGLPF
jgi:YggT family protein